MPHRTKKSKSWAQAEAGLLLSQRVHACYPQAVMTLLEVPYTDEDLTVDVAVPDGYSIREVSDMLIHLCLEIEDALGVSILTQVSRLPPKASEAR